MKISEIITEDITPKDLSDIERFADVIWSKVGVDVNLRGHFLDQIKRREHDDAPISVAELIRLFRKEYENYSNPIASTKPEGKAVMTDKLTDINVPFVMKSLPRSKNKEIVPMTIMRKPNFWTADHKYVVR